MAAPTSAGSRMRPVSFRTEDDWQLRGSFWEARADGAISLLLIHDRSSNRGMWDAYVPFFLSRGWNVLTFDLRGHGESVRHAGPGALHGRPDDEERGWSYDVRAALAYLARNPKGNARKCAALGIGLGADLAYAAAACGWGVAGIVGVSPDHEHARALAGTENFAPRGASLLYGGLDATGNAAALAFAMAALAPAECHAYDDSSAVGVALWNERQPEIVARSIAWIERVT